MGTGTLNLNILKTENQSDAIIELTDSGVNGGIIVKGVSSFNDSASFNSIVKFGGSDITYNFVPAGAVMPFAMLTAPTGWLECDGTEYSQTGDYANLYAAIGDAYNIGTETAGYFRLPDLRGEFIRGFDHGRGIDADRDSDGALGLAQSDDYGSHYHNTGLSGYPSSSDALAMIYGADTITSTGRFFVTNAGTATYSPRTSTVGGTETRPRNIAMMYCIKY